MNFIDLLQNILISAGCRRNEIMMYENNRTLTIFTPTYNRAYILPALYESLIGQTSNDFEWLIVDDGSTDNTRSIVEEWIKEKKIIIRYFYQENSGKQIAMNLGAEKCHTPLFDCVDSDDYMVPDAIEKIIQFWNDNMNDGVAGIVSLRGKNENESLTGKYMPDGISQCHFMELYEKYRFSGDTNLIYRTDIIQKYPYKLFPGERFIGEATQYLQIDDHYEMLLMNKINVVCEYLQDGYTKNVYSLLKNNPLGYRYLKGLSYQHLNGILSRYLEMVKYCCADHMCGDHKGYIEAPSKITYLLAKIPGLIAFHIYFGKL